MPLLQINSQASPYWDSLVHIYLRSFPVDEQRPVTDIARLLAEEPRYTLYAVIGDKSAPLRPTGKPSALHGETKVSFVATDAHLASASLKRDSVLILRHEIAERVTKKNCPHFKGDESSEALAERIGGGQTTSTSSPFGLLTTWTFDGFTYIEHFALSPEVRGQGHGTEALQQLIARTVQPLILEAEPPTDTLTRRRIRFYERSGLILYDYPYLQPAYTADSQPVELRLMGTLDTQRTPLDQVSRTLHREVYGCP